MKRLVAPLALAASLLAVPSLAQNVTTVPSLPQPMQVAAFLNYDGSRGAHQLMSVGAFCQLNASQFASVGVPCNVDATMPAGMSFNFQPRPVAIGTL